MNPKTDDFEKKLESIERSALFSYSIQYFWHKKQKILLNIIKKYLLLNKNKEIKIADFGCEIGHDLFKIYDVFNKHHSLKYFGYDINENALEIANTRKNYNKRKSDLFNFSQFNIETDVLPGYYDIIILSEILEHLTDYQNVLNKVIQKLNKGGLLIISSPNPDNKTLYYLKKFKINKYIKVNDYNRVVSEAGYDHISCVSDEKISQVVKNYNLNVLDKKRITFFYGNRYLDDRPFFFGLYLLIDCIFDKLKILNNFTYGNFYVIG